MLRLKVFEHKNDEVAEKLHENVDRWSVGVLLFISTKVIAMLLFKAILDTKWVLDFRFSCEFYFVLCMCLYSYIIRIVQTSGHEIFKDFSDNDKINTSSSSEKSDKSDKKNKSDLEDALMQN